MRLRGLRPFCKKGGRNLKGARRRAVDEYRQLPSLFYYRQYQERPHSTGRSSSQDGEHRLIGRPLGLPRRLTAQGSDNSIESSDWDESGSAGYSYGITF